MPNESLVFVTLVILAFAVALNLALTFRMSALLRALAAPKSLTVPTGQQVGEFGGRFAKSGQSFLSKDILGEFSFFIFLSSQCPKCLATIPELVEIVPAAIASGHAVWIICQDKTDGLQCIPNESPLREYVIELDGGMGKRLNPQSASPYYLFLDGLGISRSGGLIGDAYWQSFAGQMHELMVQEGAGR